MVDVFILGCLVGVCEDEDWFGETSQWFEFKPAEKVNLPACDLLELTGGVWTAYRQTPTGDVPFMSGLVLLSFTTHTPPTEGGE